MPAASLSGERWNPGVQANSRRRPGSRPIRCEEGAPGEEDRGHRREQDLQVQDQALAARIERIGRDASAIGGEIAARHLPQAGQAGAHRGIVREPAAIAGNLGVDDRPRAHEAHLADQHIDQLGQFIEAGLAQEASERGDTGIAPQLLVARPLRARRRVALQQRLQARIGVDAHGAEFQAAEVPAPQTDPGMGEERRAAVFGPDQESDREEQRGHKDQAGRRDQNVDRPPDHIDADPPQRRSTHEPRIQGGDRVGQEMPPARDNLWIASLYVARKVLFGGTITYGDRCKSWSAPPLNEP